MDGMEGEEVGPGKCKCNFVVTLMLLSLFPESFAIFFTPAPLQHLKKLGGEVFFFRTGCHFSALGVICSIPIQNE